ncbi:hypothetical protein BASA50_000729 [Batrachochytrium salamandrivorans]|uniref:Cation-transporting ATPase n=1 Tax=Batrachochytrium salamandrivorans TaxID=1357716 RepID=A0ABQ8ETF5_9FUNG|nr:hypothetical protein BASA50_000729 [Batrachochytrium salamandrivorans]
MLPSMDTLAHNEFNEPSSMTLQRYIETLERIATTPGPKSSEVRTLLQLSSQAIQCDPTFLSPEYIYISGYVESSLGLTLFIFLSILTCGILPLLSKWKPYIWCALARSRADAFRDATFVLVIGPNGSTVELPVLSTETSGIATSGIPFKELRYFEYRKQRYVYKEMFSNFQRQNSRLFESFTEIHGMRYGKTTEEVDLLTHIHGPNSIDIGRTPAHIFFLDKILHPFYIFQIASVAIWMCEMYTSYALLIVSLSTISIAWEVYTLRNSEDQLRRLTEDQSALFPVMRDGELRHLDASQLVVGDAIILSASNTALKGTTLACDMVLIQGECVMDESSLTGKTVPVVKFPLPYTLSESSANSAVRRPSSSTLGGVYRNTTSSRNPNPIRKQNDQKAINSDHHQLHILFGGSQFVEIKPRKNWMSSVSTASISEPEMAIAIVMATGFSSSKGILLRSILFPTNIEFKFNADSYKYLAGLAFIALVAFVNRFIYAYHRGSTLQNTIFSSLDLITIAVPPVLPLILTFGTRLSIERLKKALIFCISPKRVDYAGRIDVMCWDKTGTLTVSKLTFYGISKVDQNTFTGITLESTLKDTADSSFINVPNSEFDHSNDSKHASSERTISLIHSMLLCHGLIMSDSGDHLGHSIDIEMFRSTGWKLLSSDHTYDISQKFSISIVCAIMSPSSVFNLDDSETERIDNESGMRESMSFVLPEQSMYILKCFDFDPHVQRSTVVASLGPSPLSQWFIFTKGSAEAVRNVCNPSTIPVNYFDTYQSYSIRGLYVIACAYKPAREEFPQQLTSELERIRRDKVEKNMIFLGFLLFENPVKQESFETVRTLRDAKIRSVIITGDSAFTAVHVARELGLCKHTILIDSHESQIKFSEIPEPERPIFSSNSRGDSNTEELDPPGLDSDPLLPLKTNNNSVLSNSCVSLDLRRHIHIDDLIHQMSLMPPQTEIAITGEALAVLSERPDIEFVNWIVGRTRVFSRIKPDQKAWIVDRLISLEKYVGMCGDGANDCGALKAAHIGLALSNSEASIVAPFTSMKQDVSDIIYLVREGRCALETSFLEFKYMAMYPLIQLMMLATLNELGSTLSNNQLFFDDIFIVTALSLSMLYTKPAEGLASDRPTDSFFSPLVIASVLSQLCFAIIFCAVNIAMTFSQPWFCSVGIATSGLDGMFFPINGSLSNYIYPCYVIDPTLDTTHGLLVESYENTSIWLFTHCMFVSVSIAFMSVTRFRSPLWTNHLFATCAAIISCVLVAILLLLLNQSKATTSGPEEYSDAIAWLFSIQSGIPVSFRFAQLGVLVIYTAISILWEVFVVDHYIRQITTRWEITNLYGLDWKRDRAVGVHNMQEEETHILISAATAESSGTDEDEEEQYA